MGSSPAWELKNNIYDRASIHLTLTSKYSSITNKHTIFVLMDKLYPEQTQHEADTANTSNQSEMRKSMYLADQICWHYKENQVNPALAGKNDASIHQTNQGW